MPPARFAIVRDLHPTHPESLRDAGGSQFFPRVYPELGFNREHGSRDARLHVQARLPNERVSLFNPV